MSSASVHAGVPDLAQVEPASNGPNSGAGAADADDDLPDAVVSYPCQTTKVITVDGVDDMLCNLAAAFACPDNCGWGELDSRSSMQAADQCAAYAISPALTILGECRALFPIQGPKAVKNSALQRGFLGRAGSKGSQHASSRSALKASSRPLNELAQLATAPASQQPDHIARVGRDLHTPSASGAAEHASGAAGLQRLRIVPDASDAEVAAAQTLS